MVHKTFKFVKDFSEEGLTIAKGKTLTLVYNTFYLEGGMLQGEYQRILNILLHNESIEPTYLIEVPMIFNKV